MDARVRPLIDLSHEQIRAMLLPVIGDAELRAIDRVGEGLSNTIYRITVDRGNTAYALRLYASGTAAFRAEYPVLLSLLGVVPVPLVLYSSPGDEHSVHPYIVYRWIDGVTLNECRRETPDALPALAAPLGRMLARIANRPAARLPKLPIAARLVRASKQLRVGRARDRLGDLLADGLRILLGQHAQRLHAIDRSSEGLVHGDFGGRNVLVALTGRHDWDVVAVLDWEAASQGSRLWDIGSLFRYSARYTVEFRDRFVEAYVGAGGDLPDDWWLAARLVDSTRLVAILDEERELPDVFAESRELIASLIADWGDPERGATSPSRPQAASAVSRDSPAHSPEPQYRQ